LQGSLVRERSMPRDDPRLDPREVARQLGVHEQTVRRWRMVGTGPKYEKDSDRVVRYRLSEVERYRREQERGDR
jgi:predicted site-specific integrase-resolvase